MISPITGKEMSLVIRREKLIYRKEEFEIFEPECWNVAIELTPPCDYSQNKRKMARLVGGYIVDIPLGVFADKPDPVSLESF